MEFKFIDYFAWFFFGNHKQLSLLPIMILYTQINNNKVYNANVASILKYGILNANRG